MSSGLQVSVCLALGILLVMTGCGCEERPRAPALTTEAVYQEDQAGIRFIVPEGWIVTGKTSLPSGTFQRPMRMVAYTPTVGVGALDLYALDIPPGKDLLAYLEQFPIGADKWTSTSPAKHDTISGEKAIRFTQTSASKGDKTRELTAFNRGVRTYLLLLTYPTKERNVRDQGRKAVDSTSWN